MKKAVFVFLLALMGCHSPESVEVNQEMSRQLVGEWRNVALKIEMNSYKNGDSTKTLVVDENNWEAKMKIRPIRTYFKQNGTYNSEHINLRDSLIFNPAGNWMILGDTLHMIDTFPQRGPIYKYRLSIKDKTVEFRGMEDCDNDGKTDDVYIGTQRRQ